MKELSRNELKQIVGGMESGDGGIFCTDGPCTLSIQGDDGEWVTRTGVCRFDWFGTNSCYCDAGLGVIPVS